MGEEFYLEREGARLFCKRFGESGAGAPAQRPPMLLLHGGLVDCDFYDRCAAYLSRAFDVATFDRRGYGRSDDSASGDYAIAVQAADAVAVARACFGDARFALIAHSVGSCIGMELVARYPRLVSKALFYEPLVPSCVDADTELGAAVAKVYGKTRSGVGVGSIGDGFLFGLALKDDRAYEPTEGERARSARNTTCSVANEGTIFMTFTPDYEALSRTPCIVGLGEMDRHAPLGAVSAVCAQRASMPIVHFPGAHNCPADLPHDFARMAAGIFLMD